MQIPNTRPRLPTLLALSLVSYREFWDPGRRGLGDEVLTSAIQEALATLPPLRDHWRLVWGPSRYDPRFSLFDDHLMYVVQQVEERHRYVFVVRATNPRSLLDWLLADPWIPWTVPWTGQDAGRDSPAAATPRISLSAALGYTILRNLRSHPPPVDPLTRLWRRAEDGAGEAVRRTGKRIATLVRGRGGRGLRTIQSPFAGDVRHLNPTEKRHRDRGAEDFLRWASTPSSRRLGPAASRALGVLEQRGLLDTFHLLAFLEGNAHLRHRVDPGVGSKPFLEEILARHDAVDIVITGHGKGGTLAMLFALHLLETQRGAPDEGWDPHGKASIRCVTFGAPPAGDRAFCRHAEQWFDGRLLQVIGARDIVPLVWSPSRAIDAFDLFLPHRPPGTFEQLTRELAQTLQPIGYDTVRSAEVRLPDAPLPDLGSYYQHAMFHHLEAYLEAEGVGQGHALSAGDLL